MRFFYPLLIALFTTLLPLQAQFAPFDGPPIRDDTPAATISLAVGQTAAVPGQELPVAITVHLKEGWHTYWLNGGVTGFPMRLTWTLPEGVDAPNNYDWPTPEKFDPGTPDLPLVSYGYHHAFTVLTTLQVPADYQGETLKLALLANMLVCEETCIPVPGNAEIELPVAAAGAETELANQELFAEARDALPVQSPSDWELAANFNGTYEIAFKLPEGVSLPETLTFLPLTNKVIDDNAAQTLSTSADQDWADAVLRFPAHPEATATPERLQGTLRGPDGWPDGTGTGIAVDLPLLISGEPQGAAVASSGGHGGVVFPTVDPAAPEATVYSGTSVANIWMAILMGLVGGLILNIMPCVLPVLSIKVLSFVEQAKEEGVSPMAHGAAYSAGVIISFWAMGVFAVAVGSWGVQFQHPTFLLIMTLVFFIFGLSLFGVFEIGGSLVGLGSGSQKSGLTGSFATGLLAVVVATPCTAPFMGPAIGWAIAQNPVTVGAVFTALGVGMASPYLVLAMFPKLVNLLPRPGAWMERLRQFFGFLMMGTAVFMLYVLGSVGGQIAIVAALACLVLVGLGCWILGVWASPINNTGTRWGARIAFALLVLLPFVAANSFVNLQTSGPSDRQVAHDAGGIEWVPWSAATVEEARASGRVIFVDFTADWCITCKVNESRAFTPAVADRFEELEVLPLMADWTRRDEAIGAALASFGRSGVPLYVIYGPYSDPIVIDGMLSPQEVIDAVNRAGTPPGAS